MRKIDTLRVAVTDRCNLRCIYCQPAGGVPELPRSELLGFKEIERVVRAALAEGVTKIRLTGGEPLVRRGLPELIARLARLPGLRDLPMTTNGILLAETARDLKAAGLRRVTVSLDTLRPLRYQRITGQAALDRVYQGLAAAREAGLAPLKINVVVVPGENDDEVLDFARLAGELDLEVRFIERMPLSAGLSPHCGRPAAEYIPAAVLRERIEAELGPLRPLPPQDPGSPARLFQVPAGGRLGFIAPLSEPFCKNCGRIRLTPDGKLRVCLAEDLELDVKGPLRRGASDQQLAEIFQTAVALKPCREAACFAPTKRSMSQIGG